ncbi:MAG: methyltransferase domain-containing protein [Sedimenticola sp.]|nr:methyltransferase domain-containing protein [Sedimenticola sp.]MCW8880861.1 methyltransferase domain-containing protein [Sedimenticola sp.]MCW8950695.1 methyltransferase domain-containing protein [Sedimenticola sp.]
MIWHPGWWIDPVIEKDLLAMWNQRHAQAEGLGQVADVLVQNIHLAKAGCKALDLACGRGANALFMARAGLKVTAWDLSPVAIERLTAAARAEHLSIASTVRDVITEPPEPGTFDLILVSYFLDRELAPAIAKALKPGGLLFYQTYSRAAVTDDGPTSDRFRLDDNELLMLFDSLRPRVYREERLLGNTEQGWRDRAMLVAEKG